METIIVCHSLKCSSVRLGLLVVLTLSLLARPLVGLFAYNVHSVVLTKYLINFEKMGSVPSGPYDWLDRSATWGNLQAERKLDYLAQSLDLKSEETDPLLLWLSAYGWMMQRLGNPLTPAVWDLPKSGYARIEAEDMLVTGASMPNRYVAYRAEKDDVHYVVLYWGLNSLVVPMVISRTGQYRFTVFAQDWPPLPLRVRINIAGEKIFFVWAQGDYAWRSRDDTIYLPRGRYILHLAYMPPIGNRTQRAGIDYVVIEKIEGENVSDN